MRWVGKEILIAAQDLHRRMRERGCVMVSDATRTGITFIPPGKLRCVITDRLRNDTLEENVRQRVARSLIDQYGYNREDIAVEFTVPIGTRRPRVDLAVFPPGTSHRAENAIILVECKRESVKPTDENNGLEQLNSYMAACENCRFGMWVGSELRVLERIVNPQGGYERAMATDIPRFGAAAPVAPRFSDLVPAEDELIAVFRRCHDYIHANQGLAKESAFNEFLKIIFCKVQDENDIARPLGFFIGNTDRRSEIGQRQLRISIEGLFADVRSRYPYIFGEDDTLGVENPGLAYIVGELQRFSLMQTRADVKGMAYEQLVGANLRGDRGEYFTPRTVCTLAAEMLLATFPQDQWLTIDVLDPAAGTGGFLVAMMNVWHDHISELERNRWGEDDQRVESETQRRIHDVTSNHLFGVDFDPVLVRAAQMNLVMHGDGSTNVYHANSLLPWGEWPDYETNNVRRHVRMGRFDAIVTNPPFGEKIQIDDPHVLAQYDLALGRSSVPPDQLFIERCFQLLRPGGRLAIVLPDSILTNPGLLEVRRWILNYARVVASIDLPVETFQPHTGTQTSVLLLQKKTDHEIEIEQAVGRPNRYEVFMAIPRAVGHDRRGNPLYLRTPAGDVIERHEPHPVFRQAPDGNTIVETTTRHHMVRHDELPSVTQQFREWVSDPERMRWLNG